MTASITKMNAIFAKTSGKPAAFVRRAQNSDLPKQAFFAGRDADSALAALFSYREPDS